MERWVLLFLSVIAACGAIESVRWLRLMQKASTREVEQVVGHDGSRLPPVARERLAISMRFGPRGLPIICIVMVLVAITLIYLTVRAFTS